MGDDITIVVPPTEQPVEPSTETSYEAIGEQLLARLDALDQRIEELHALIAICSERIAVCEQREFATVEHQHEGFAAAGHTHDGYALIEHEHERKEERPRDKEPESQHPYFRKLWGE
jgi:hypothetical protein